MDLFPKIFNEPMEIISELLEATLNEDGYQTKRFEEAGHQTSCYRGIYIQGRDGQTYEIMLNQVKDTEGITFPERKEGVIPW